MVVIYIETETKIEKPTSDGWYLGKLDYSSGFHEFPFFENRFWKDYDTENEMGYEFTYSDTEVVIWLKDDTIDESLLQKK